MRVAFPWYDGPEGAAFDVPDGTAVLRPPPSGAAVAGDEALARAFASPVAAPRLAHLAESAKQVLVLVDDATRGTPAHEILPHVARELAQAGVQDEQVTILTAQGTHRRMTSAELEKKIGAPMLRRWRVEQHDWKDEAKLVDVGRTSEGMPVVVNRLTQEADLVLGVGHVGVHPIMGFSGGAKIVLPGVCGAPSEAWTHWTANWYAQEQLLGVPEGPIRAAIEEGARMAGLDAVANVVLDPEGRIAHAEYGDPVRAQRACAIRARAANAATLAAPVDIVVTDSHPADRDYWQSAKGLYSATIAVAQDGIIVLASPNAEGVADNHPELTKLAMLPLEEIRRRVEAREVEDVIAAAVAAYTARMRERSRVFLVSSGIRPADARALGFEPYATVERALAAAREEKGASASVAVLQHSGSLLPIVGGRNDRLAVAPRAEAA